MMKKETRRQSCRLYIDALLISGLGNCEVTRFQSQKTAIESLMDALANKIARNVLPTANIPARFFRKKSVF